MPHGNQRRQHSHHHGQQRQNNCTSSSYRQLAERSLEPSSTAQNMSAQPLEPPMPSTEPPRGPRAPRRERDNGALRSLGRMGFLQPSALPVTTTKPLGMVIGLGTREVVPVQQASQTNTRHNANKNHEMSRPNDIHPRSQQSNNPQQQQHVASRPRNEPSGSRERHHDIQHNAPDSTPVRQRKPQPPQEDLFIQRNSRNPNNVPIQRSRTEQTDFHPSRRHLGVVQEPELNVRNSPRKDVFKRASEKQLSFLRPNTQEPQAVVEKSGTDKPLSFLRLTVQEPQDDVEKSGAGKALSFLRPKTQGSETNIDTSEPETPLSFLNRGARDSRMEVDTNADQQPKTLKRRLENESLDDESTKRIKMEGVNEKPQQSKESRPVEQATTQAPVARKQATSLPKVQEQSTSELAAKQALSKAKEYVEARKVQVQSNTPPKPVEITMNKPIPTSKDSLPKTKVQTNETPGRQTSTPKSVPITPLLTPLSQTTPAKTTPSPPSLDELRRAVLNTIPRKSASSLEDNTTPVKKPEPIIVKSPLLPTDEKKAPTKRPEPTARNTPLPPKPSVGSTTIIAENETDEQKLKAVVSARLKLATEAKVIGQRLEEMIAAKAAKTAQNTDTKTKTDDKTAPKTETAAHPTANPVSKPAAEKKDISNKTEGPQYMKRLTGSTASLILKKDAPGTETKKRKLSISSTFFPESEPPAKRIDTTARPTPKPATTARLSPPPITLPPKPAESRATKLVAAPRSSVRQMDTYIPSTSPAFLRSQFPVPGASSSSLPAKPPAKKATPPARRRALDNSVKALCLRTEANMHDEAFMAETERLCYYQKEEEDLDTVTMDIEDYEIWRKTGVVP